MYLYNFYVAKPNLPFETLTYSSEAELSRGQLCLVEIKTTQYYAVVASNSNLEQSNIKNLKQVFKAFDCILPEQQMEFYIKVGFLTFNSFGNFLNYGIKPFEILVDNNPTLTYLSIVDKKMQSAINYNITTNWSNIISELLLTKNYNKVLIITPEKKLIKKIKTQTEEAVAISNEGSNYNFHDLTSTSNKKLSLAYNQYYSQLENTIVNFSTKNEMFTTLINYDLIIIIDEANPSYISETKVYFDTREVAYWASQIYSINLEFVSTLPSVRFSGMVTDKLDKLKNPTISLKFLERSARQDDFSNVLSEIQDDGMIFGDDEV
jgi:primosomal protein N'